MVHNNYCKIELKCHRQQYINIIINSINSIMRCDAIFRLVVLQSLVVDLNN